MKPYILLSGDDSVRAEGLILVKRVVESMGLDYRIVATKEQQSAVGPGITVKGGEWGKEVVDGVETIWVEGKPSDAVNFAMNYFEERPQLVISGMNMGENLTESIFISGTVGAAMVSSVQFLVPTVAFSFYTETSNDLRDHDGSFNEKFEKYPGDLMRKIIEKSLDGNIVPGTFWNVNFPIDEVKDIIPVKIANDGYYLNHVDIDDESYKYGGIRQREGWPDGTDAGELLKGNATICAVKVGFDYKEGREKLDELF